MITFFRYGSEVIAIETCAPGAGDMRVGVGASQVKAIDNLEAIAIPGHLEVSEGLRNLLVHGLSDPKTRPEELEELVPETKSDVGNWENFTSFVCTFSDGDRDSACDVTIQIGRSGGGWFLRTTDEAGGEDECSDTAYSSKDEAIEAAQEIAEANHEANEGENAAEYLTRQLRETAGSPCQDGEYCVSWQSACQEDCHVFARYATIEQATAATELSNQQLAAENPGQLLCGYEVRQMVPVNGHMIWVTVNETVDD